MRGEASVLHLDLDAFYAAVEQRDKPSLRGKPVVVGGIGARGVVATASYEARRFGIRSAMPTHEARRRCPHAAFLAPRFAAYQEASRRVMELLREVSPVIEPLSLDEAYVDLRHRPGQDFGEAALTALVHALKQKVAAATGGLTASAGVGTSKLVAKVASELRKPDGLLVVPRGTEVHLLGPLPVGVIPGVGPVTVEKLRRIGILRVADLQRLGRDERTGLDDLGVILGRTHAREVLDLAWAQDDRAVVAQRETKSISTEDTFETDIVATSALHAIVDRHARAVAARLDGAGLLARTVTLKVRRHDFTTITRAKSLIEATRQSDLISAVAHGLLQGLDTTSGVRLLGVGVSNLVEATQEDLFALSPPDRARASDGEPQPATAPAEPQAGPAVQSARSGSTAWVPGAEVRHDAYGDGWVWGSGLGRVTVRFETRHTPPGSVRTFRGDDPALRQR